MMRYLVLGITLLCSFSLAYGQDQTLIKNVRLFDGAIVTEGTSVLIEGELVKAVGPDVAADPAAQVIDASGQTLMPALSNAHVHAWSPETLKEAADAGVLNVMDMHGIERFQQMLRQLNDSTGYATYYIAGAAATAPEGHGTQFGFPTPTLSTPEEAPQFIADRVAANVDYVKIIVEPWKKTLSSETVEALIREAHKAKKLAVVHVSRLEDAMMVLGHDADALVHIWWDKEISKNQLEQLKTREFFVIPTLLTTLKAFETMEMEADQFMSKAQLLSQIKILFDAGVPILAGTDPPNLGINYGTDLYQEMELLSEAGLSPIEVLKTATSNVATAFGIDNKGFVRPGYKADLILLERNPLENITNISSISQVWKGGKPLKK
jgi:imidazolonepropionase-like amidohydrolase